MPLSIVSKDLQVVDALGAYSNLTVPVSSPAEARLRCGAAGWEQSFNGSAWAGFGGGGFTRFTWLAQGSTRAQIQAALNNAAYDGVYLEPGPLAYAINGANLTIPDGKFLIGAYGNPDPVGTRAILALGAGFQILGQKGTLAYCNIVWTAGSLLPAYLGAGGVADHVHVSTSAGTTSVYAFNGIFSTLSSCSCARMSGVNVTGNPALDGSAWTVISRFYASGGVAGAFGIYTNPAASKILIDGCRIDGGGCGINLNQSESVHIRDCFVSGATTVGVNTSFAFYLVIKGLEIKDCVSGLYISQSWRATVNGVIVRGTTGGSSITTVSCTNSSFDNLIMYSNERDTFYADTCTQCTYNGITVDTSVYAVGGTAGITFVGCTGCTGSDFVSKDISGSTTNYGVLFHTLNACVFRNVVAMSCTCKGVLITSCINSSFSGFSARDVGQAGGTNYGIYIAGTESSTFSDFRVRSCANWGIYVSNSLDCTFSGFSVRDCTFQGGIYCTGTDRSTWTGFAAYNCTGTGISVNDCDTGTFSNFHAETNSVDGIKLTANKQGTFTGFVGNSNTGNGITESGCERCELSAFEAKSNSMAGVAAGFNSLYNHWGNISCTSNTGVGFSTTAPLSLCKIEGLYTQLNGTPFSFLAGWQVSLGQEKMTRTVTAAMSPYSALLADEVILVNAVAGPVTVNLPLVATLIGKHFYVKKIDATANAVTIQEAGGALIDGITPRVINVQWQSLHIESDGAALYLI